ERGTLRFTGPVNAPQLDVLATRRGIDNEQQRVGVSVTGNALNPRVRLYADPDMSDTEKLAFLVSGRSFSALGRNDAALVQRAAFALLQGEGGGATDLLKAAGLDDFSVEQRANGTVQSTVVTLGKQISQRLYVGYERGLNATSGALQLIYRLSQRFTLRAQSGTSAGMDLIWQWSWN
ncbi:MAG: translocation/assembly module TamB domain-containing protein, partial [Betaproteobacteria bacterium]|nr:translocation/assembly module TamB domain-containing protein [Betaproteobacteria bacterium]